MYNRGKKMTQKMIFSTLGGTGIVSTLVIAGIALKVLQVSPEMGNLAITSGIGIGVLLGALGVLGVAMKVLR
jgi:hypothetical protein